MATAQNGWPIIPNTTAGRRKLADLVLPGGAMPHTVRVLAGDVATIAMWHVREYHRRVEKIKPAGCWGWNVRKIGTGPYWSNHSAACAWDLNAPDNPDGVPTKRVMTSAQIEQCHELERESDGVLRWGGDWSDPDAMHWEIVGTPAQVAALAKKIRKQEEPPKGWDEMATEQQVEAAAKRGAVAALKEPLPYALPRIKDRGWAVLSINGKLDYLFEQLAAPQTTDVDGDGDQDSNSLQSRLVRVETALSEIKALLTPPPV